MNGTRSEPAYRLQLFGGPIVTGPDGPVKLSPRQAQLLSLVYAHETRPLSRRQAIWLMWEKDDTKEARHSLREVLYKIKERLGFRAILTPDQESLVPDLDALSSDLVGFRGWVGAGSPSRGAQAIRFGFLSTLRGSPGDQFLDWRDAKSLRLQQDLRDAAAGLWDKSFPEKSWKVCREAAEALYTLEPCCGPTVRKIIEARAMTGSSEGAEVAYRTFLETLEPEEGPPRELVELIERVRRLKPVAGRGRLQGHTTFFGRSRELGVLRLGWERLSPTGAALASVWGESGLGKTRLATEFATEVHLAGAVVVQWTCHASDATLPLGPVANALCSDELGAAVERLGEPWRSVLQNLQPGVTAVGVVPTLGAADANRRLLESVRRLLVTIAADQPLLVILDDSHWADQTTLAALEFIRARWSDSPLLVLLLHQPLQFFQDRRQAPPGLLTCIDWDLELGGLDSASSRSLVESLSDHELPPAAVEKVVAATGGNPLLLSELALSGNGIPTTESSERPRLPASCEKLYRARLDHLSQPALSILQALSVAWTPLSSAALGDICSLDGPAVIHATDELFAARLVVFTPVSTAVRHDVIRWVTLRAIGPAQLSAHHLLIGDHLQREGGATDHHLAMHYSVGGRRDQAFLFACSSAAQAERQGALHEAIRSLSLARENSNSPAERLRLAAREGELLWRGRERERAVSTLSLAIEGLRAEGLEAEALKAEILLLDALQSASLLPQDMLDAISRVRTAAASRGLDALACDALDVELHSADGAGNLLAARRVLSAAAHHVQHATDLRVRCSALCTLAGGNYYTANHNGPAAATEALKLARGLGDPGLELKAANRLVMSLIHSGEFGIRGGMDIIHTALLVADNAGHLLSSFHLRLNRGVWLLECGALTEAVSALAEADRVVQGVGPPGDQALVLVNQGEVWIHLAEYESASLAFQQTLDLLHEQPTSKLYSIALAGLGLASFGRGERLKARDLERQLPRDPTFWIHDPTLITTFRSRLLEKTGQAMHAAEYLGHCMENIKGRFQTVWIKLGLERARILRAAGSSEARRVADAVMSEASRLGLGTRVLEARVLASSKRSGR